ncbi:MAG TPA: plastocyanin/azurin family copper-binding protein [Solirubrobacterales bacterium]
MRRAAVAIGALALAAFIAGPLPGAASRDDALSSVPCTWKRHSKRVVRHVRRHGRVRRVVRIKHWWTCARPPAPPGLGGGAPTAPGAGQQPSEEGPTVGRLGVKASEYKFVLSRPSLQAGEAIVELDNQGEDPHNLNLQLADGEGPEYHVGEVGSQKRTSQRFTLPAGTYRLWCSIPGHEELGMKATLTVTP